MASLALRSRQGGKILAMLGSSTLLVVTLAVAYGSLGISQTAAAQGSYAAAGRAKFNQRRYDEAIDLFRRHLRRAPRDYSTWNQLGAAYYHTGQPRKALRYLKQVERRTLDKSYNYYYQGLCYTASESPAKAREYFHFIAARYQDEYAARASFEMAAIEYNAKDGRRAHYWARHYVSRYPNGPYRAQAQKMLQYIAQNDFSQRFEGIEKPDIEKALFRYSHLSLGTGQHYWLVEGGWQYAELAGQEPDPKGGLKPRNNTNMAGLVNAGIGGGPFRQGDIAAFMGYNYRQRWITDLDRVDVFLEDPTDIQYFPLRGDLLERRHQLYGDFRRELAYGWFFGLFGRYEMARIGSTLFPGPDDAELRKVLKISDTTLLIPWIGLSYLGNMRTLFYFYLRKELNEDSPEHSNKSYELGLTGGSEGPLFSFGMSHDMEFPEEKLNVNFELFRYQFVYNDYWLDYERTGAFLSLDHEILPRWFIYGLGGYYQDIYIMPRVKLKPCGLQPQALGNETTGGEGVSQPKACPRTDTGTLFQAGIWWNWTQFQRFSADVQLVQNRNPDQTEFEESKTMFQFYYTMAFPSVKRVTRMVNRYADTAFTKEAE